MATRHSSFGVVINPELETKVDWTKIDDSELLPILRETKFPDRMRLVEILNKVRIKGQPRKGAKAKDSNGHYNVKITNHGGQMERGAGGAPHWQLWVEVKPQTTKTALLTALSKALYNKDKSKAISIQETGLQTDDLKNYCNKEGRLILSEEFSNTVVDKATGDYQEYLERNPSLKKYLIVQGHINNTFFNL